MELKNWNDIEKYIEKKFPDNHEKVYISVVEKFQEFAKKYQHQKGMFFAVYSTNLIEQDEKFMTKIVLEKICEGCDPIQTCSKAFADIVKYMQDL